MKEKTPKEKSIQKESIFFAKIDWQKTIKRIALLIGVGVLLNIAFIFYTNEDIRLQDLFSFSPIWLFWAAVLGFLPWIANAYEIQIWTIFFKRKVSFYEAFQIAVITDLGSAVTPTLIGGGSFKLALLMRKGLSASKAAAMITFTGIEDLLFMLLMIPLSIFFSDKIESSVLNNMLQSIQQKITAINGSTILYFIAIFILLAIILYLFRKNTFLIKVKQTVNNLTNEFLDAYKMIFKEGKIYFLLAFTSIAVRWVFRFLIVICLVKGLGLNLNHIELMLSQWMIYLGMTFTPTPGAIGGAEGLFYFIFKDTIPKEFITIIIAAWRFFTYYYMLILAALMTMYFSRTSKLLER